MKSRKRGSLRNRTTTQAKRRNDTGGNSKPIINLSQYESVEKFFPKIDRQNISILPYVAGTNHPQLEEGEEDYKLDIWIHPQIGPGNDPVLCLKETFGMDCPICEERRRMMNEEDLEWNDPACSALAPSRRCWYNIIDNNNPEKGIQIWEKVSFANFEKRLLATAEEDYEEVIIFGDLEEGADVKFKIVEATFPIGKDKKKIIKFHNYENFSLESRDPLEENLWEDTYPLDQLLIVPTYEEVLALLTGRSEDKEGKDEEESTPPPKEKFPRKGPKEGRENSKKRVRKKEPEEEEENKCPCGFVYGVDSQKYPECSDDDKCSEEDFNTCADLKDELALQNVKEEEEVKEEEVPLLTKKKSSSTKKRSFKRK